MSAPSLLMASLDLSLLLDLTLIFVCMEEMHVYNCKVNIKNMFPLLYAQDATSLSLLVQ